MPRCAGYATPGAPRSVNRVVRWLWIVLTWVVVLGGCASSRTGADTAATTLTVHIGVFGGPARPNGGMAVSNAPRAGAAVTVTDGSGNQWHATTDRDGIARFSVAPGQYAVHDPCDFRDHHVTVRAGKVAHVDAHCDVT